MNTVNRRIELFVYLLAALAFIALFAWFSYFKLPDFHWVTVLTALILASFSILAHSLQIEFRLGIVDVTDISVFLALIALGPEWAILVAIPGMIFGSLLRTTFVASCDVLVILTAGYTFSLFAEPTLALEAMSIEVVYGTVVAASVFYTVDALINSTLMRVKYDVALLDNLRTSFLPSIPSDAVTIFTTLGSIYIMSLFGPAAALVLFVGAVGAITSLHLIHTRQKENEALKLENSELRAAAVGFAAGMVSAIGEKDGFTARLAAASSVYAGDLGSEFGLDPDRTNTLRISALLQDVGMVSVPDGVSSSPTKKLNPLGRSHLEHHTVAGEEVLARAPGFEEAAKWVRWHHERMDGTGYPDGLKGQWLPLEARILGVCEVYASLVLDTPGSPALGAHDARVELTSQSGTGLDGEVVRALLRVLDREDAEYGIASGERFEFANPAQEMVRKSPGLRVVGDG